MCTVWCTIYRVYCDQCPLSIVSVFYSGGHRHQFSLEAAQTDAVTGMHNGTISQYTRLHWQNNPGQENLGLNEGILISSYFIIKSLNKSVTACQIYHSGPLSNIQTSVLLVTWIPLVTGLVHKKVHKFRIISVIVNQSFH